MAKHYPQMVCNTHRQQRQKKQSTFTEITSAFDGPGPCAPWGTPSPSCADTESVAGLKCTGTVTPTLPTASFVPAARAGGSSLAAQKTPQERQSQCADSSNTGSGIFCFLQKFMERLCCSSFFLLPPPIPEFVTAPQLYVLRRLAALGLEGLLLAFRTFSVTLLRFLLSDPSLDPGSDEVFSFSLLLGFSVVFAKLPEGAKTEIGPK